MSLRSRTAQSQLRSASVSRLQAFFLRLRQRSAVAGEPTLDGKVPHGRIASRRLPRAILAVWAAAIVGLGVLGERVESRLSPLTLTVPGSPSARAEALLHREFGNSIPIAILLRGSPAALEREGPLLARALAVLPGAQVLSPFHERGALAQAAAQELRPQPDSALVLVSFNRPASAAMAIVGEAQRAIARTIHPPVHSYLTGLAVIGKALQEATLADTNRAEWIAFPILILVLLLVFRSPIAAALPLLMGGATVVAGHGLLWLASFVTPINSLGVAIAAMMSLALGVDYALLMISRVRQELAAGRGHDEAVAVARAAAGRTIVAAGGTLALTMLAASGIATPGLLGPVAIGVVISGLLSVALALGALPAALLLLGPLLNRWTLPSLRKRGGGHYRGVSSVAERLIAQPFLVAPVILVVMLALGVPASALQMGPPDAAELPASSPVRAAVRAFERTIGPGWSAPFVIVARGRQGPMTTEGRIDKLIDWQTEIARVPGVAAVIGPGSVAGAQRLLAEAHAQLLALPRRLASARGGVAKLRAGLARAVRGVGTLRSGLGLAVAAAAKLAAGAGAGRAGAARLASEDALARSGAAALAAGATRSQAGARRLADGIERAHSGATQIAGSSASAAVGAKRLASGSKRAQEGAAALAAGLAQAAAGSARLAAGLVEAQAGATRLRESDHRLAEDAAGMEALDTAIQPFAAPLELLAEELRAWSGAIEAALSFDAQIEAQLLDAMEALKTMKGARREAGYPVLAQALERLRALLVEAGPLGKEARERLETTLRQLLELPEKLVAMLRDLNRLTIGARRIATGARESEAGAATLAAGLGALSAGGQSVAAGTAALSNGAERLRGGLVRLGGGEARLAEGLARLSAANRQLADGLGALAGGGSRLANGLGALAGGGSRLANGLGALAAGGASLARGLGRLAAGSARLESGLAGARARTGALAVGLRGADAPLGRAQSTLARYARYWQLLQAQAPGTISSGYLVLAALDGTIPPLREEVSQLVNVDHGGQTVRLMVVPGSAPNSSATAALAGRLRRLLPALAASTESEVQIGEGAQYLLDYKNANTARFPLLVLALAGIAAVMLVVILQAVPIALLAVGLNLATISVALGTLQLLTAAHLLGGPGYIDAASGAGIVSIMFVLSIDYEVFLLMRMREHWLARRDANAAIFHGLGNTAGVITGSAAIMTAVFCAFASASVVPLRQFGIGLTIAVLLDATLVRLVLLPALMRLAGARIWWLPRALERRLPAIEGTASA